jgi:hypothetical protein
MITFYLISFFVVIGSANRQQHYGPGITATNTVFFGPRWLLQHISGLETLAIAQSQYFRIPFSR